MNVDVFDDFPVGTVGLIAVDDREPDPGDRAGVPGPGRPPGRGGRLAPAGAERSTATPADSDTTGSGESEISETSEGVTESAARGTAAGWVKGYARKLPTVMTRTPPVASAIGPHRIVTLCF
ncbi:hypothetical protein [Dactylosporangium darangshiense]|uniref:Uncharacterized protein n=1 Tax=Dactylosporangium darangshiense TaxID=579108 RepID=A0ABP8D3H7_9ACTN